MERLSSDAEGDETVIATTTYIYLEGSHTTESEIVQDKGKDESITPESLTATHEKQHQEPTKICIQEPPLLQAAVPISTLTEKQPRTEVRMQEPQPSGAPTCTYRSTWTEVPRPSIEVARTQELLAANSTARQATFASQTQSENARESACCKVHTIVMDQSSIESIATVLEPAETPRPQQQRQQRRVNRLLTIWREMWLTVGVCLQLNRDCIFCLLFFMAFVVSASFLTAFFYKTMTLNPQMFQYPVQSGRIYYV